MICSKKLKKETRKYVKLVKSKQLKTDKQKKVVKKLLG